MAEFNIDTTINASPDTDVVNTKTLNTQGTYVDRDIKITTTVPKIQEGSTTNTLKGSSYVSTSSSGSWTVSNYCAIKEGYQKSKQINDYIAFNGIRLIKGTPYFTITNYEKTVSFNFTEDTDGNMYIY